MDNKLKGYLLLFASVILASLAPIYAKVVQQTMPTESSSFYWFMSAFFWSTIFLFLTKKQKGLIISTKKYWKKLLVFGICNGLAVLLWFYSVKAIGASSTAFIDRIQTIYLVLLGVILLKEKFNKWEIAGMLLAIVGVFAFTYTPTTIFNLGALYVITGAFIFSFAQIIAKKEVQKIDPFVLVFIRALITFTLLTVFMLMFSKPTVPSSKNILILIFIPPLSAVFQFWLAYTAFKYIDISKATIVQNLIPLTTWFFAWLIIRETLSLLQVIGGMLIIGGVVAIVLFKNKTGK